MKCISNLKLFNIYHTQLLNNKRKYTTPVKLTSKQVRQQFLDYFIKDHSHDFIKSSPVVPLHDATLPFVNAGMNQFKGIFLGTQSSKYKRVANVQKCVRVGGKHNDLECVGMDGYHHTFFEMLGNWSFDKCSKMESCQLAWRLLTDVYKIKQHSLYVTYFGGDEEVGIEPDLECRDVWKTIGVADDHIIPFGMQENFWEMGLSGPCGPSTEIHFDHSGRPHRATLVNKGLHELVEIWNLVFIEYNRDANGNIKPLPTQHLDTGMGFERLVAALQGKVSNYDTDVFKVLFDATHKICKNIPKYENCYGENDWNHLNMAYRILTDHTRMITVCLADGMIPEQNQKLRRVMRRAFATSENTFKKQNGLIKELSNYVIENLGYVYPEIENNAKQIHQIIDYEEEIYHSLRANASNDWSKIAEQCPSLINLDILEMPGLIFAFKELQGVDEINAKLAYKLYDTYGLDAETIGKLSDALAIKFNRSDFNQALNDAKYRSKYAHTSTDGGTAVKCIDCANFGFVTNDSFKYDYAKMNEQYSFKELSVRVLSIVRNGKFVDFIEPNEECALILDKTNFYGEAGGQDGDRGVIKFGSQIGDFHVHHIEQVDNCILHCGRLLAEAAEAANLAVNQIGASHVDEERRLAHMRNHTATHLLNAFVKRAKGATCQKSSKVNVGGLHLDVGIFADKLTIDEVATIEDDIKKVIEAGVQVNTLMLNSQSLLHMDKVTLIPGEVYPDKNIRIIEIGWNHEILSREPCCGTHVLNTSDLQDFCIINVKSLGRSTSSIYAVTGRKAQEARANGDEILKSIRQLQKNVDNNIEKSDVMEIAVASLKQKLNGNVKEDSSIIPYTVRCKCFEQLEWLNKRIKESSRMNLKEFIDMEMENVVKTKLMKSNTNKEFIVHYLRTPMTTAEAISLQKVTKNCKDIPAIVISYIDNTVKARCCVPQKCITKEFNAEKWLQVVSDVFKASVQAPKGQNADEVVNMKGKKVNLSDWHTMLDSSLAEAKLYAKNHLK